MKPSPRITALNVVVLSLVLLAGLLSGGVAGAQEEGALDSGWISGPTTVNLGSNVAQMKMGFGYSFADADLTRTIMQAMGNPPTDREVGLIAPDDEDKSWFIVFEYEPSGYVEDTDRDEIDADAILKSISEGTEAANEYRREHGGGSLHVIGWAVQPHYDPASNNLVWAIEAEDETGARLVNYNVRLLGRRGYMSVTLVTDSSQLVRDKPEIDAVLAGFQYVPGNRYADFTSGDKLAGYGLTALVAGAGGAAAAKLGLFAVMAKFFAKAWKLLVIGVIAVGAFLRRIASAFFGRKQPDVPPTPMG